MVVPFATADNRFVDDVRVMGNVLHRLRVPRRVGVTDVITSPPYLDTTNYREDQWLRLWFLGGGPLMPRGRGDDRHYNEDNYWTFIRESMQGLAPLLAGRARMVIRIGGRRLRKVELREGLLRTLSLGLERDVQLIDDGVTTQVGKTQGRNRRPRRSRG